MQALKPGVWGVVIGSILTMIAASACPTRLIGFLTPPLQDPLAGQASLAHLGQVDFAAPELRVDVISEPT